MLCIAWEEECSAAQNLFYLEHSSGSTAPQPHVARMSSEGGQRALCCKLFIDQARRQAHALPRVSAWLQGIVVWRNESLLLIDDGSGLALVNASSADVADASALKDHVIVEGDYVLVTGLAALPRDEAPGLARDVDIVPSTVCKLPASKVPLLESLWNIEVVDAWVRGRDGGK